MDWYEIFPKILNMSVTASIMILFVLLVKLVLKKAPKIYSYALWAAVLFRLLCPVSVSAPVSLLEVLKVATVENSTGTSTMQYIPADIVHTEYPEVNLPISGINEVINDTLPQGEEQLVADPLEAPTSIVTYIWLLGVACMAGYACISYFRLKKKLVYSLRLRDNIFLADHIPSSFVTGLVHPRIYLSSGLTEKEQEYIILHEKHHIKRCDHIFKALAFVALSIHWFNPLVWVAFFLSCRDMEMSCDEAVIKKMGEEIRADYSASLLNLAAGQRISLGMPLAFGEGDTKGRIKNLARWKKPKIWITITAGIVCIVVILICIFNPEEDPSNSSEASESLLSSEEPYILETFEKTASLEELERNFALEQEWVHTTYYKMSDGTWKTDEYVYQYRLEVSGRLNNAAVDTTYIILSNKKDITFEQAWKASGFSSNIDDYFDPKDAVIVATILHETPASLETSVSRAILEHGKSPYSDENGYFDCESHVVLSTETATEASAADEDEQMEKITVYAMVLTQTYDLSGGAVVDEGGSHMPAAITFSIDDTGAYKFEEYWTPMDGSGYEPSIREKFPDSVEEDAIDTQKYILAQIQDCYTQAVEYGNLDTDAIVMKLLNEILASPGLEAESSLARYIQNERITYRELTYYGAYTLKACFREFLKGGQTDLRGLLMAEVCQDIMTGFGEALITDYEPANGQEWFDAFRANAESLKNQFAAENIRETYPVSAMLMDILASQESVSKDFREETLGRGQYLDLIEWESIQAMLTDSEAQAVKKYQHVLEGDEFTWIYRSAEGEEPDTYVHDKKQVNIEAWVQEAYERNGLEAKAPEVDYFVFADVFESGNENICILFRHLGYEWLILHEEDGVIYGIDMPVRWFCGVQKNGLYYGAGGAGTAHYKRMIFNNGDYTEEAVGDEIDGILYINGEQKSAEDYAKWKSNNIGEEAKTYYPKEE